MSHHHPRSVFSTDFHNFLIFRVYMIQMRHLTPLTRAAMPPCIQLLWDTETRNINQTFDMRNSSKRNELLSNAAQMSSNVRSPIDTSTAPSSSLVEAYPCSMFSFLGDVLCPEVACAIADGHMDPSTRVISSPAILCYAILCYVMICHAMMYHAM